MRRREIGPDGLAALDDAVVATALVRDARAQMMRHAEARRQAVLRANKGGASYRAIAAHLGISMPAVQHMVVAARDAETGA